MKTRYFSPNLFKLAPSLLTSAMLKYLVFIKSKNAVSKMNGF
jgi:hypothetical protein